ncbi:hypothetical protein GGI07_000097 [Coemansia sp. Benny D115]|nr:hypothetical protein GGI07_000097 [Coemansia sp. Benny D115]
MYQYHTEALFYSPEDQLQEERRRLTPSKPESSAGDTTGGPQKRARLYYEGEPDTTKWAVPPPPDILAFTQSPSTPTNQPPPQQPQQPQQPPSHSHPPAHHPSSPLPSLKSTEHVAEDPPLSFDLSILSPEVLQQIRGLCAAQNDFERRLYDHRCRLQGEYDRAVKHLEARELLGPVTTKEKDDVLRQHRMDLDRADRRAIEKLDELRYQQQMQLQGLGVPGFYPSSNISVMQAQQTTLRRILEPRKT